VSLTGTIPKRSAIMNKEQKELLCIIVIGTILWTTLVIGLIHKYL